MLPTTPRGGKPLPPPTIATINGYRIVIDTKGRLEPGDILTYVDHGLTLVSPQARAQLLAETIEHLRELPEFVRPGQSRI